MNADSLVARALDINAPLADRLDAARRVLTTDINDGTLGGTTETGACHLRALEMALGECAEIARENARALSRREVEAKRNAGLLAALSGRHRTNLQSVR